MLPVRWIHDLAFRLRALFTPGSVERDMDDEMAFHLDMEAEKYIRQGMSETEARARCGALAALPDRRNTLVKRGA